MKISHTIPEKYFELMKIRAKHKTVIQGTTENFMDESLRTYVLVDTVLEGRSQDHRGCIT